MAGHAQVRSVMDSDFIRKVVETFTTKVLLIGIGLVMAVLVARILGPEGRGLYAVAVVIGVIGVQFGNFGLHASNTYFVAKNRNLLPVLLGNSLFASFIFGGLSATIAWIIFFLFPNIAPLHGVLLILALLWIPLGLAYLLLQNILLGIHEVRAYNKIELTAQIVAVILIGIVIALRAATVELIFAVGLVILAISILWAFRRIKSHATQRPRISLSLFKENIQYGVRAYFSAFFSFLILRLDLLMVKYMLDAEQAGYYSIATSLAEMILLLPSVTASLLFPRLAEMADSRGKWLFTNKIAQYVGLISLATVILAGALAKPMVRLLFGAAFLPAMPAFLWLLPGIYLLSISIIYSHYLASIGMPLITAYSPGVAVILNIFLNIKMIPIFGIVGASISSSICYALMLFMTVIYSSYFSRPIRDKLSN